MSNTKQSKDSGVADASVVSSALTGIQEIIYSSGRRGVHIFGLSPDQTAIATICLVLIGIPFALILAMTPVWDHVGELLPVKKLNSYIAPAVEQVGLDYRARALPRFPLKRFLVASECLIGLILLINMLGLFVLGLRRHALLVWTCYDRRKLIQYLIVASVAFCGLWYAVFVDWTLMIFINGGRKGGQIDLFVIVAVPLVAVFLGHLASIFAIGCARAGRNMLRRRRRAGRVDTSL